MSNWTEYKDLRSYLHGFVSGRQFTTSVELAAGGMEAAFWSISGSDNDISLILFAIGKERLIRGEYQFNPDNAANGFFKVDTFALSHVQSKELIATPSKYDQKWSKTTFGVQRLDLTFPKEKIELLSTNFNSPTNLFEEAVQLLLQY